MTASSEGVAMASAIAAYAQGINRPDSSRGAALTAGGHKYKDDSTNAALNKSNSIIQRPEEAAERHAKESTLDQSSRQSLPKGDTGAEQNSAIVRGNEDGMFISPSRRTESYQTRILKRTPSRSSSEASLSVIDSNTPLRKSSSPRDLRSRTDLAASIESESEHLYDLMDYAETEWWGWIILIVTWFVFVVGMGSSLGVWSWAWDVGETPYAPPELEDDPTLPIVGYYPALIVLTAVMSWVWVTIAWVGMKYFKHAIMSGEDA